MTNLLPGTHIEVMVMGQWFPGYIRVDQTGVPPRTRAIIYGSTHIHCWAKTSQLRIPA